MYSIMQVKSIYVCNLPSSVDEEMMKSVFSEFGEIERIVLSRNLTSAVRILLELRLPLFFFINFFVKIAKGRLRFCKLCGPRECIESH